MGKRVAVLGARGIGKFHAREFRDAGCEVVAILGRNDETAQETSKILFKEFSIEARPYGNLADLLKKEEIDAVSICTPPEMHEKHIILCLNAGVNVLCEKPLILSLKNMKKRSEELFRLAAQKNLILSVNTQMVSLLDYIDVDIFTDLEIYTEPGTKGVIMLEDFLPHANSILVRMVKNGYAEDIKFIVDEFEKKVISFVYKSREKQIKVLFVFSHKPSRPRAFKFVIDGKIYERIIGQNYNQRLVSKSDSKEIEDPLKLSIRQFVASLNKKGSPIVSKEEILENISLQETIMKEYSLALDTNKNL